jgi:hypothetical protein
MTNARRIVVVFHLDVDLAFDDDIASCRQGPARLRGHERICDQQENQGRHQPRQAHLGLRTGRLTPAPGQQGKDDADAEARRWSWAAGPGERRRDAICAPTCSFVGGR